MWATIKKLVKDLLTENDGLSYCPIRCFAAAISVPGILLFVIGYSVQIYKGQFDGQQMAIAFSTIMAGFAASGLGIAAKATTDKSVDSSNN